MAYIHRLHWHNPIATAIVPEPNRYNLIDRSLVVAGFIATASSLSNPLIHYLIGPSGSIGFEKLLWLATFSSEETIFKNDL
jgi:hypothetical protein